MRLDLKRLSIVIFSLSLLFFSGTAYTEERVVEAKGEYIMNTGESEKQAEQWALQDAKRIALEQVGTYLQSYTKVVNGQLETDEVIAVASGTIRLVPNSIQKQYIKLNKGKLSKIVLTARFIVDSNELEDQIAILRDKQNGQAAIRSLKKIQDKYNQLLLENKKLKEKLLTTNNLQQRKELEAQNNRNQREFAYNQNMDEWHKKWLEAKEKAEKEGMKNSILDGYNLQIRLNPNDAKLYYSRGTTYYDLNKYQQAIADFDKAISINPSYTNAYLKRAVSYYCLEQYEQALLDCNILIQFDPNRSVFYMLRGHTYYCLGNKQAAIVNYRKSLKLDPSNKDSVPQELIKFL